MAEFTIGAPVGIYEKDVYLNATLHCKGTVARITKTQIIVTTEAGETMRFSKRRLRQIGWHSPGYFVIRPA